MYIYINRKKNINYLIKHFQLKFRIRNAHLKIGFITFPIKNILLNLTFFVGNAIIIFSGTFCNFR